MSQPALGEPSGTANRPPLPDVTIVIPVYKNAATLAELYRRLCLSLEAAALSFELLFVDDHCPEDSARIIRALGESDRRVRGLILAKNIGQHRAVTFALQYVRGPQAVIMDADLQDPPEDILSLLAPLQRGYAAVFAARYGAFQAEHRLLTSRLFKGLMHLLTGIPRNAGMYIALNREMMTALLRMNEPQPYVVGMVGLAGLPITSVPVTRANRPIGQSAYSSLHRLRMGAAAVALILALKIGWRRLWPARPAAGNISVRDYIGPGFDSTAPPGQEA